MKKVLVLLMLTFTFLMCFVSCDQGQTQDPTPEHTHDFGEWSVTKTPTCTEDGVNSRYCNCGEKQSDTIPATGHEEQILSAKEASCIVNGLTEGKKCSNCGEVIVAQQEIPVVAHKYDDKYDEECNVCGDKRDAECAHSETEVIKGHVATCTVTGLTDGTKCKKCGYVIKQQTTIPVKSHTEVVDSAVEATCTSTGLTQGKHCSVCSKVLVAQTVINMKPHSEEIDTAVEATCTSTGLTEGKHCSVCKEVLVAQEVLLISHKFANEYICDDDYHWKKCQDCTAITQKITHDLDDNGICTICDTPIVPTPGIIYDISTDGTYAEVIGYEGKSEKVKIADTYEGLPVKHIYNKSFEKSNISFIILPDQLISIGEYVFNKCYNLENIQFPNRLESIGKGAFLNCDSLTSITIPDSVIDLGFGAFQSCSELKTVVVGDGVTKIQDWTFVNCGKLEDVLIGNNVESIGKWAFKDCGNLGVIYKNCRYIANNENKFFAIISVENVNHSSYIIHKDTKVIANDTFANCERMEKIYYEGGWDTCYDIFNDPLSDTIYLFSDSEPLESGNYWHYVDDVPTIWE